MQNRFNRGVWYHGDIKMMSSHQIVMCDISETSHGKSSSQSWRLRKVLTLARRPRRPSLERASNAPRIVCHRHLMTIQSDLVNIVLLPWMSLTNVRNYAIDLFCLSWSVIPAFWLPKRTPKQQWPQRPREMRIMRTLATKQTTCASFCLSVRGQGFISRLPGKCPEKNR